MNNPYTWEEFEVKCNAGNWYGGYVEGLDYVLGDPQVFGSRHSSLSGFDSSLSAFDFHYWENYHWSIPFWYPNWGTGGGGGGNAYPGGDDETWPDPNNQIDFPPYAPEKYDGALMAGIVYQDKYKNTYKRWLGERWTILSANVYRGVTLFNESSGFKSMLFIQMDENYNITNCVYAFAGTDTDSLTEFGNDFWTDVHQLFAMDIQYKYAIHNAIEISRIMGDIPLTFVGHSLGGGLAAIASMVTGRPAITYNPAALSDATLSWLEERDYNTDVSNIYSFVMEDDYLPYVQSIPIIFRNAEQGHIFPVANTEGGDGHKIHNMIKCLQPK